MNLAGGEAEGGCQEWAREPTGAGGDGDVMVEETDLIVSLS